MLFIQTVLSRLYQYATNAYHWHNKTGTPACIPSSKCPYNEDLALFGGQARLLRNAASRTQPSETSVSSGSSSQGRTPPPPQMETSSSSATLPVHESLNEYQAFFPASAFAPGFDIRGKVTNEAVPFTASESLPQITTADIASYYHSSTSILNASQDQSFINTAQTLHPPEVEMPWMQFDLPLSNAVEHMPLPMDMSDILEGSLDDVDVSNRKWYEFLQQSGLTGNGVQMR